MIYNSPFKKVKKIILNLSIIIIIFILFALQTSRAKDETASIAPAAPAVLGESQIYVANKSDNLYSIARKFGIALDHIMITNNLKSINVSTGKNLTIPTIWISPEQIESGIILNLPERNIYFFKENKVKSIYPVAVGNTGRWTTPTGDYKIISKTKNPVWLPPEWAGIEKPVLPGPQNPLGDRWMGLSIPGYGIHATNNPMSVGAVTTHGCIRMYPEDAQKLFNQIKIGDPAKIIYETIKIGFSEQTGKFYISVFPDIYYQGTNSISNLESKLKKFGLEKFVPVNNLIKHLKNAKGIPEPILGESVQIKINEKPIWLPLAVIKKNQSLLVSEHLFSLLNFEINFYPETKMMQLKQNYHQLTVSLDQELASYDNEIISLESPPTLLQNYIILPLDLLKYFDYKINYMPSEQIINITL